MSWLYPGGIPAALSLVGYNALLTSFFVWMKRRDKTGAGYVLASFSTFGWALGYSFMANSELPESTVHFWGTLSHAALFLMPVTWLHFVLIYTGKEKKKLLLAVSYAAAAAFLLFLPSRWFIMGFRISGGIHDYPVPGPAFKALSVLFAAVLIYSFMELYESWKEERAPLKREDYRLFFFAQLFGYGLTALTLLPAYGFDIPQYQLLALPLWQFFMAYAMVRRHLMDYEELARAIRRDKLAVMTTVAASMHHEIKNPLFIMHGSSEAFLHKLHSGAFKSREETASAAEEVVSKHYQLVLRIMDIIQSFSRFAKTKTDQDARKEKVYVPGVLREVMPLLRYQMNKEKIHFEEAVPEGLPPVLGDPRQLEEIFFNLLVNACRAVKEGGLIKIGAKEEKGRIEIWIEDNGEGITKEQMRHLYDPFYTTRKDGTGLGLYITKKLTEQNGGEISLVSEPGKRTVFSVSLPVYPG